MASPIPKPTNIKVFEGNRGKRALNKNEPKFAKGELFPPKDLGDFGRIEWDRLSPQLKSMKLLDSASYSTFVAMCRAWDLYNLANLEIQGSGLVVIVETKFGERRQANPAIKIAKDALADYHRLSKHFGLTPSSRSTLEVPNMGDKGDEFDEI